MPEPPTTDQEQNRKTDEEIRRERIAAVTQPQVRAELEALVRARDARLAEITQKQAEEFERGVVAKMASRANAGRHPGYRGAAPPATREACAQALQVEYRAARELEAIPYNKVIDEILEAQRDQSRQARQVSQQLAEIRSDGRPPDAPRTAQAEEERQPPGVKRNQGQEERPIEATERPSDKTAENPVDWRRILKDPDYRREVQEREFGRAGREVTQEVPEREFRRAGREVTRGPEL